METRVPLNRLPTEVAAALQKTWDKEGAGYVTIAELCAGASGVNSARNARQARTMAGMGKNRPQAVPMGGGGGFQPGQGKGTTMSQERWEMPGDLAVLDSLGLGEGQGIWERMAAIVRARRLDVRILLDAHDKRNAGLVDLETFRRALCYAFGNNWIELAMTSAEFDEVCKPYLTRNPNRPGEPPGFVFWQKFSVDLQTLADRRTHSDNFMSRLAKVEARERVGAKLVKEYGVTEYELKSTFAALKDRLKSHGGSAAQGQLTAAFRRMDGNHSGKVRAPEIKKFLDETQRGLEQIPSRILDCIVDLCDSDGDGEIDYGEMSKMILCDDIIELLALVPDKTLKNKAQNTKNTTVGKRNVKIGELQAGQQSIKRVLMNKYGTVQKALRAMDTKGDGTLSRDEIKQMMQRHQLLKHVDYYTGAIHGELTEACLDTLIDYVDVDRDGRINYQEFTRVLVAEDIMHIPPPRSGVNTSQLWGDGR